MSELAHNSSVTFAAVQPSHLNQIIHKVKHSEYRSTRAFLSDIKCIHHNVHNKNDENGIKAADLLLSFTMEEMLSIDTCADCHLNANLHPNTWFTMVCTKPHLLLWAKLSGFSFWPAKLLSTQGEKVCVRFFGHEHGRANIPARNCCLYLKNWIPSKSSMNSNFFEATEVSIKQQSKKFSLEFNKNLFHHIGS